MPRQMQHAEVRRDAKRQHRARGVAVELPRAEGGRPSLVDLHRQIGNQAVQHLLTQRSEDQRALIVQRYPPTEAELRAASEASMERAGVNPNFPAIHAVLEVEAHRHRHLPYAEWRRISRNQTEAQYVFGRTLNQAWDVVQGGFLSYLVGSVASNVIGVVINIIPVAEQIIDEGRWARSPEYRERVVFAWLLNQLALRIVSTARGRRVTSWDSQVQAVHDQLISQTMNFRRWFNSPEAQALRMLAMEQRGEHPGQSYWRSGTQ